MCAWMQTILKESLRLNSNYKKLWQKVTLVHLLMPHMYNEPKIL